MQSDFEQAGLVPIINNARLMAGVFGEEYARVVTPLYVALLAQRDLATKAIEALSELADRHKADRPAIPPPVGADIA